MTVTGSGFMDAGLTLDTVDSTRAVTSAPRALWPLCVTVVSDTEITVTAPDAADAADGLPSLLSPLDVSFTNADDPDNSVTPRRHGGRER